MTYFAGFIYVFHLSLGAIFHDKLEFVVEYRSFRLSVLLKNTPSDQATCISLCKYKYLNLENAHLKNTPSDVATLAVFISFWKYKH